MLTKPQQVQESQYSIPYHYADLFGNAWMRITGFSEYLSFVAAIKRHLSPFRGQVVLDAGCGDGRLVFELRKEKLRIVGVDYSERAIAFARAFNPGVRLEVQSLESIKLAKKFDYIVLAEVLEHILPEKIPAVLRGLYRNLKPGGSFIVTVPSKNLPLAAKHYQHFTPESLASTLQPYFNVRKVEGLNRRGWRRWIYRISALITYVLAPFENILPLRWSYRLIAGYYRRVLATGKPEDCTGLLAVCEKARQ